MAYDKQGHVRLPGEASIGTGTGSVKSCHKFMTNDDVATVETAGYFNVAYLDFQTGDQLDCSLDIDGANPIRKDYVVKRAGTVITLIAALS